MIAAAADLWRDTAVERVADDAWHAVLGTAWNFQYPSGGVLATVALRAAAAALDDDTQRLVSATTTFCAPLHPGPLRAEVVLLRRGTAASQLRVRLRNHYAPGHEVRASEGLEVTCTFARDRVGPDVRGAAPPDVPGPAAAVDVHDGHPANPYARLPFFANLDVRLVTGGRWWAPDFVAGPARFARWLRYRTPVRDAAGLLPRAALAPLIDLMPGALVEALGPTPYKFYAPSLDLTMHIIDDTARDWLLCVVEVPRARVGWAVGRCEVWDDDGRQLAIGSQAMYLSGVAGVPPTVDATGR